MQNFDVNGLYYGVWKTAGKKERQFVPLGRRPEVTDVLESIEDDTVTLKLATEFFGRRKTAYLSCADLVGLKAVNALSAQGFDVTMGKAQYFLESIRRYMDWLENDDTPVTPSYENLGWIRVPSENPDTGEDEYALCYRAHELVGAEDKVRYLGNLEITPSGDFEIWKRMVIDDVIPHPAMQFGLIASLSAVVIGALSLVIPIENPIIHFWLKSGAGKTTLAYLGTSVYGKPFEGTMTVIDEDGRAVDKHSVMGTWGGTTASMTTSLAGNRGVATILNELGKNIAKDLDRLLFDFSEGSDRKRLSTTLKTRVSKSYATTFLSTGECSLLEKCQNRLEGLAVRVMEITSPITKDAAHANRVKRISSENYGFAAPMLAEYIIKNGGAEYVRNRYDYWRINLRPKFGDTPNVDRFIEKFAALFMATAEIASKALSIGFDMTGLLNFLKAYDAKQGTNRNTSLASYELLLEHFKRKEHSNFYIRHDKSFVYGSGSTTAVETPKFECYGRITEKSVPQPDGRVLVREYEVHPSVVESLLRANKFYSTSTCADAWIAAGLLDADSDHLTKKRKIGSSNANGHHGRVFVFKEFVDGLEATEIIDAIAKKNARLQKLSSSSQKAALLSDEE
ncbi:MAG: DUF927 domain-containing protein [Clostridia bacterium]|nr:DUF927 domain-containing protein [Clostridia bacterium]